MVMYFHAYKYLKNLLNSYFVNSSPFFFLMGLYLLLFSGEGVQYLQLDAPRSWQIFFQDPATVIMEGIIDFHHDLTFLIVVLCIFVTYMMCITI